MPDRVILLTGTSRGIGRSLAEHFLAQGDRVIGCSRSETDLSDPLYRHHCLSLHDEAAVRAMFSAVRQEFGTLHVLINNAGLGLATLAMGTSLSAAEGLLQTNLLGTFLCCREAAKIMMKNKFGRIINVSSIAVATAMEGASLYSASKAGVEQFTIVLAKEVASLGITCNTVVPSLIDTDMFQSLSEAARSKYLAAMTIKQPASMADMINAVEFFASAESSAITGQRLALSRAG